MDKDGLMHGPGILACDAGRGPRIDSNGRGQERSVMQHPLRLGVWALVHGNRAALNDPEEPYDASWDRNRRLVLEAEALGYDCTLVAQHTTNPHRDDLDHLEAWTSSAALAALSNPIEIIT